jgi:hypothetical protein
MDRPHCASAPAAALAAERERLSMAAAIRSRRIFMTQRRAASFRKGAGELGRCCRCRPVRYLNNIVEQDHRAIKRRARASQVSFLRFGSANDSSYRDGAHDPQGTGQMVGQGRHRWADPIRSRALPFQRCLIARTYHSSRSQSQVCNTSG